MLSVGAGNIASNVAGEIHNRCIQRLVTLAVAHCVVGPRGRLREHAPKPCFLRYAVRGGVRGETGVGCGVRGEEVRG